jgi:type II secretory pathway predicted ATPase ExeA
VYSDHFNFKERPFSHAPGLRFVEPNATVRDAIGRLQHVLSARDAIALVTGGPGVGKSTLAERALAALPERAAVARVDLRYGEAEDIYAALLLALDAEAAGLRPVQALHALRQLMARFVREDRLLVLSLDIGGVTVDLARHLLRVVNLAGEHDCRMNFLIMGPHPLHQQFDVPAVIQLRQRIALRHRTRPLTLSETDSYIRRQIEAVGGDPSALLSGNVSAAVYCYVAGVPRLINTLLDATLSDAALQKQQRIDGGLIKRTADSLGWKPMTPPQGTAESVRNAAGRPGRIVGAPGAPPRVAILAGTESPAARPAGPEPGRMAGRPDLPPASDMTQALRANGGGGNGRPPVTLASDAKSPTAALFGTGEAPKRATSLPAMDAQDTSATGMLRLQDIDERFAETIFGDEAEDMKTKEPTENG